MIFVATILLFVTCAALLLFGARHKILYGYILALMINFSLVPFDFSQGVMAFSIGFIDAALALFVAYHHGKRFALSVVSLVITAIVNLGIVATEFFIGLYGPETIVHLNVVQFLFTNYVLIIFALNAVQAFDIMRGVFSGIAREIYFLTNWSRHNIFNWLRVSPLSLEESGEGNKDFQGAPAE